MKLIKGRGAQINTPNKFDKYDCTREIDEGQKTKFTMIKSTSILNKVDSPDVGMSWSLNPYQGCEHGCIYCYARNTHNYLGLSAGLDFETKIMVKKNAPLILEKRIKSKKWKALPIMLSGNTDCYQPAEQKFKITRNILEVLWRYRHPVGIITKNSLIKRDMDLLIKLSRHNLLRVAISLTTLDDKLRSILEPRTSTVATKLDTIQSLSDAGIPVSVMMAPIIPGLNDIEIFRLVKEVADRGAKAAHYTIVRLNGDVQLLFKDWLQKTYPDRADKILHKIEECHGGQVSDSRFGTRMRGEGNTSDIISKQFALAKNKYLKGRRLPEFNLTLHEEFKHPQMSLF